MKSNVKEIKIQLTFIVSLNEKNYRRVIVKQKTHSKTEDS